MISLSEGMVMENGDVSSHVRRWGGHVDTQWRSALEEVRGRER